MRVQLNLTTTVFTAPVTIAPSWSSGSAPRSLPQPKPVRRQHSPKPRSVPQPRPLPKPGSNR